MNDLNKVTQTNDDKLNQALEAMYFGFRAIIAKPDQLLSTLSLSRVHHRILYFIARNPHLNVKELLAKLDVTKQYVHLPMRKLIEDGYILTKPDEKDRRIKRLSLTLKGEALEESLSGIQRNQFEHVFAKVGQEAEVHWRLVMETLIEEGSQI